MKIKLAVLFGGRTTEHEVSIISAVQAMHAMDKKKYDVIPIYISKNNEFYYNPEGKLTNIENYKNIPNLLNFCKKVVLYRKNEKVYVKEVENTFFAPKDISEIDVVFPIVHGTNIEDGTLAGFINLLHIPCVGCNVLSSALGMDKYVMKKFLMQEGVPVLDGRRYNLLDYKRENEVIADIEATFEYPVIVKPINLGSSIGISIGRDKDSLSKALEAAFKFAEEVIVEKAITNLREINISILGDKYDCVASVCEEPIKKDEILSFANKYLKDDAPTKGMASHGDANLDEYTKGIIEDIALDTFKALGCSGVARVDCMIDVDTNSIYVNEINTIPGSLSFYLWEKTGLKYNELIDRLVKIAVDGFRREEKLSSSFETNLLSNHKLFKNK